MAWKPGFKLKLPLVGFWLVTDRRLRAGYHHRYEQGYLEGVAAGRAAGEAAAREPIAFELRRQPSDAYRDGAGRDALADAASG